MIEEASLIATYVTMGITPIVYNLLAARRALRKRREEQPREERVEERGEERSSDFTLTIPCNITFTQVDGYGHAVHLSIRSVHPLPASHVKRLLRQS